MEKGLGVGAMIVAILAIFVPVVGIYVVWLGLGLAVLAALLGDRVYPIVAVLISVVNIVFLSPMILLLLKGENIEGNSLMLYITLGLIVAPIGAMIFSVIQGAKSKGELS